MDESDRSVSGAVVSADVMRSRSAKWGCPPYDFTTGVKSDHCSMRKARMSRTDFGNHVLARSAWMARNNVAMSSSSVTYKLP